MISGECKKRCIQGHLVLCAHYDNRFTLAAMREYCGCRGNTFTSTAFSDLLFIDDDINFDDDEKE